MTSAPWWEQFFDEDYLRVWATMPTLGEEEAAALWRILGLSPGARVLDAGCGYGRVSLPLARLGARVLGVDQSATLLAEAERRRGELDPEQLRYQRRDLRAPLGESGFDVALSLFSSLGYGEESDDAAILGTIATFPPGLTAAAIVPRIAASSDSSPYPSELNRLSATSKPDSPSGARRSRRW